MSEKRLPCPFCGIAPAWGIMNANSYNSPYAIDWYTDTGISGPCRFRAIAMKNPVKFRGEIWEGHGPTKRKAKLAAIKAAMEAEGEK